MPEELVVKEIIEETKQAKRSAKALARLTVKRTKPTDQYEQHRLGEEQEQQQQNQEQVVGDVGGDNMTTTNANYSRGDNDNSNDNEVVVVEGEESEVSDSDDEAYQSPHNEQERLNSMNNYFSYTRNPAQLRHLWTQKTKEIKHIDELLKILWTWFEALRDTIFYETFDKHNWVWFLSNISRTPLNWLESPSNIGRLLDIL